MIESRPAAAGEVMGVPSSLIVAGFAAVWLVGLVPLVAKRRQEVRRTADSALASRVLQRPPPQDRVVDEGMAGMTERSAGRVTEAGEASQQRPFRPGRGGFDPEAAALAANAKYVLRQRVVIGLLAATVASLALALLVSTAMWWATAAVVASLAAYLAYLRRQVRIEEEVRRRRIARLATGRRARAREHGEYDDGEHDDGEQDEYNDGERDDGEPDLADEPMPPAVRVVPSGRRLAAVEIDDEDPELDDPDPGLQPRYRRAVGE